MRDDRVPLLGFNPVTVCEVMELLMLFYYLGSSDYDLLVHLFAFLYNVDVISLGLGRVTNTGTIE